MTQLPAFVPDYSMSISFASCNAYADHGSRRAEAGSGGKGARRSSFSDGVVIVYE